MIQNEIRMLYKDNNHAGYFQSSSIKFDFDNGIRVSIWMDSESPDIKNYFAIEGAQVCIIDLKTNEWISYKYPKKNKLDFDVNCGVFYDVSPNNIADIMHWAKKYSVQTKK